MIISALNRWKKQIWYFPLLMTAMALMMLRPVLIAAILTPDKFAIYSYGLLASSTFCMLGCLGLQPMLQRRMPADLMIGRVIASKILLIQAVGIAIFIFFVLSLFGLIGFVVGGTDDFGLMLGLFHGLSQQLFLIATLESKSRGKPLLFGWQNFLRAFWVVIAALTVALYTQTAEAVILIEAIISIFLSYKIIRNFISSKNFGFTFFYKISARRIKKINWASSFSLMVVMLAGFLLTNLDRWIAASQYPRDLFAYYAFAAIVLTSLQSVQVVINTAVYPALVRKIKLYGRSEAFRMASRISIIMLFIGCIIAWPIYEIIKTIISNFLSEYTSSLNIIFVFVFVGIIRASDFYTSYLIVIQREKTVLFVNVAVGVVIFLLWMMMFFSEGMGGLIKVSYLALGFAITNYIVIFTCAYRVRSENVANKSSS